MIRAVVAGMAVLAGAKAAAAVLGIADRRPVSTARRLPRSRLPVPGRLGPALADAAVEVPPGTVWSAWLAATAATVVVGLLVGGPGLALVGGVGVAGGPTLGLLAARDRSSRRVEAALPEALDAVARSLRSGATLPDAIAEAAADGRGRLADDLDTVAAAVRAGLPLGSALDLWPARCPTPGVRLATAAFALSAEAGGAAAQAIDGVAATLRANRAVASEVRAQAAQARLSAMVIALAPLAFGALAAGTDQRTAEFLLRTPIGVACLAGGLALDATAAWWMHRITVAPT